MVATRLEHRRRRVLWVAILLAGLLLGIFAAWPRRPDCEAAKAAVERTIRTRLAWRARGQAAPPEVVPIPPGCLDAVRGAGRGTAAPKGVGVDGGRR